MEEKTYIFEGKTTNEAIEKGLKELKVSKNRVEIKVLEEESKKTFFSILAPKVVKVEMKLKEVAKVEAKSQDEVLKELKIHLDEFISKLPTKDIEYNLEVVDRNIKIKIKDENASYLIGYKGETILALQNILSQFVSEKRQQRIRVLVDICEYREKREEDLKKLAQKTAETVEKTKKSIALEPMPAVDRKIIHSYLQNNENIKTHSVGIEPRRKVIVSLK